MRYRILVIFIFISSLFRAQGFSRAYYLGNSTGSSANDAFEAPDGTILLTGTIVDTVKNANLLCIVAVDANGSFLWQKTYGRATFQYLNNGFMSRAAITDANFFYVYTAAVDSNSKYFSALIKFNYNGDTIWQKTYYNNTGHLYIQGVAKSIDNGFLMTGFFEETPRTTLLIKTDLSGNELWRKKIQKGTGLNTQVGHKIIQDTATGNIVIAGHQYESDGTSQGFSGYANIIVTNSLGVVVSKAKYGDNVGSGFRDLIQARDKKCIAVGYNGQWTPPGVYRKNRGYAVKFDLNSPANYIWKKEFDIPAAYNHVLAVTELQNGDLVLVGMLDTLGEYNLGSLPLIRIIKLDKDGNLKWKRYLYQEQILQNIKDVTSINKTADGGFVMPYQLPYLFPGVRPYGLVKIDSTACDSSLAYCTVLREVGVKEIKTKDLAIKIFPNPVKDVLNLEISGAETKHMALSILDLQGREIKRTEIRSNTKIDVSDLNSGLYFITVRREKEVIYKEKLIKE